MECFCPRQVASMDYKVCVILAFLHFYVLLSRSEAGNHKQTVIKTIKNKDGDIFDCIDIMSQPTFLDPRFKNHKIQMTPSSFPVSINEEAPSNEIHIQAEIYSVPCPSGTIPIWRNQRKNITSFYIKDKLKHILRKIEYPKQGNRKLHMASLGTVARPYGNFGASGALNVYKPEVKIGKEDRLSGSSIYINNGTTGEDQDYIEAGWFVRPSISGDNDVRFHIFWQDSNRRKECINLACSGFVQTAKDFALGAKIAPVSIYEGPQFEITIHMLKDEETGNWWLTWGKERKLLGYWEKSIFNHMDAGAFRASWGGMVVYIDGEESPAMGSGHFPHEGYGRAAFVRDPKYVDVKTNKWVSLNEDNFYKIVDVWKCYDVGKPRNYEFYFGGPAGCKR